MRRDHDAPSAPLPAVMASGRKPPDKPEARRRKVGVGSEAKPDEPEMTPERWAAYHRGELIADREASSMPFIGRAYPRSLLGLDGLDWDDERYRRAYRDYVILRDEDPDEAGTEDGRPVWFVSPGRHSPDDLLKFFERFAGKHLKVLHAYDRSLGYAVVRMTEAVAIQLQRRGFEVRPEGWPGRLPFVIP